MSAKTKKITIKPIVTEKAQAMSLNNYSEMIRRIYAGEYDGCSAPVAFDRIVEDIAIGIATEQHVPGLRNALKHWDGRITYGRIISSGVGAHESSPARGAMRCVRITRVRDCLDHAFRHIATRSGRNSRRHMPVIAQKKEAVCCAMTRLAGIRKSGSFVRALRGCVEEWAPNYATYGGGVLAGKYPASRQNGWKSRPSVRALKRKQVIRRKLGL